MCSSVLGKMLTVNEIINVVNTTELIYFDIPNPMFGQWRAVYFTQSPSTCVFNIDAMTNLYVDPGFIPIVNYQVAPLLDNPRPVITQGVPNFFLAHPNGLPCIGRITSLSVFENFVLVYQSSAQVRYHCAYEYYFGWITCNLLSVYQFQVMILPHYSNVLCINRWSYMIFL